MHVAKRSSRYFAQKVRPAATLVLLKLLISYYILTLSDTISLKTCLLLIYAYTIVARTQPILHIKIFLVQE